MTVYSKENDDFKYMWTCIGVFSKYAWVHILKNKVGPEVTIAFELILKQGLAP